MRAALVTLLLAALSGVALGDAGEEALRLNEEGVALAKARRYPEALEKLVEAHRLLPSDDTIRRNLATVRYEHGSALAALGELEEAVEELRAAVAKDPESALFATKLGIVLMKLEKPGEAKQWFARALAVDPAIVAARARLGQILHAEGALKSAIREWERVMEQDPGREDVGKLLEAARREYEAEKDHTQEDSAHFVVSWDGRQDRSVGARILRVLEDAYESVGVELGIYPSDKVRVVLYSEQEFHAVTGTKAWVGALYDGRIRIPVKNFFTAEDRIAGSIRHEYTHVAVHSVTERCPAWLNEGLAQHFEGRDPRVAAALSVQAAREQALYSLAELEQPFTRFGDAAAARLAYAQSHSLTAFLLEEHGPDRIGRFLRALAEGKGPDEASGAAFHRDLRRIRLAWLSWLGL